MPILSVRHLTTYRYRQPVGFGEHRILFRPRDSYDQRLISATLKITPEPSGLRWLHDVFGNCVAVATFRILLLSLVTLTPLATFSVRTTRSITQLRPQITRPICR